MKAPVRKAAVLLMLAVPMLTLASQAPAQAAKSPAQLPSGSFLGKSLGLIEPAKRSPLTERKRFHGYLRHMLGPVPVFAALAGAGISQGLDSPPEWGQGGSGYGKRVANSFGTNAVRQTITYGLSYAFQEDNRYFASGKHGFWHRTFYAVTSPALATNEDGSRSVSISALSGIAGASLISRSWAPPSWRSAHNVAESMALTYGVSAGFDFAREFVPDLLRHMRARR